MPRQEPEAPLSSDDEEPDQESFADGKVVADNVRNSMLELKRKEKEQLKLKRQLREALFVSQKKKKVARLEKQSELRNELSKNLEDKAETDAECIPGEIQVNPDSEVADPVSILQLPKTGSKRKFYKDFNVEVTKVNDLKDSRASKAIDFKSKRLAKPHRESVLTNSIHREKLRVAGKI